MSHIHEWKERGLTGLVTSWRRNCNTRTLYSRKDRTGRRGRSRELLLDDLEETKGYWQLQEEAVDGAAEMCVSKRQWVPHKLNK